MRGGRKLWADHKLLLLGFVLAVMLTLFMVGRLAVMTVYFTHHRDAELAGWMPIFYISRSYEVAPEVLVSALGLTQEQARRKSIEMIAAQQNRPLEAVKQDILTAVQAARDAQ